jgi:hypothetical protein
MIRPTITWDNEESCYGVQLGNRYYEVVEDRLVAASKGEGVADTGSLY